MVMGMARGLGDGLLRLCNGAWRDDDGDAVDIVEVVRCKDCKHWSYISGLDKEPHCTVFCGLNSKAYPTDPDDYCSKGERKDNGAE